MREPPATPDSPASVTADVELSVAGQRLRMKLTVPTGPTTWRMMLPLVQDLTNRVVNAAIQEVEEQGQRISCKKGCGACCRQLVPITEVEARRIRDLVDELPEPRRSEIQDRFADARRRLEDDGVLQRLLHRQEWKDGEGRAIGLEYFSRGIPCPFLEAESCSIHADRPLACREYLVTSPAENCAGPTAETVRMVTLPLKVSNALAQMNEGQPPARSIRWVPLILAPEWAEAHPDEPPPRSGPELVRDLFQRLTDKEIPLPEPPS
jgi:Fe-S-cluster containining protein